MIRHHLFRLLWGASFLCVFASAQTVHTKIAWNNLPLGFEPAPANGGNAARYIARGRGYSMLVSASQAALSLHAGKSQPEDLQFTFVGGNPDAAAVALQPLVTKVNYFPTGDPATWRSNIPTYGKVAFHGIYAGIDLAYYGRQGNLEYDWIVSPGADPSLIRVAVSAAQSLRIRGNGDLEIILPSGKIIAQHKPAIYQKGNGARAAVAGGFELFGKNQFGFRIPKYDRGQPLVIDPVLSYSSYLGGENNDEIHSVALDPSGNIYVSGISDSANFPGATVPSSNLPSYAYWVFVSKFDSTGTQLLYTSFLAP